jgi:hypothetical protein
VAFGNGCELVGCHCPTLHAMVVRQVGIAVEEEQMGIEEFAVFPNIHTKSFTEKMSVKRRTCVQIGAIVYRSIAF